MIREKINKVLKRYPEVAFAYLFGSEARGDKTPLSDLDIAIYMKEYSGDRVLSIHADLARALKRSDIDLVILNRTRNLLLLEDIIRNGQLVYEKDHDLCVDFELRTIHLAIDFRTQRKAVMGI